MSLFRNKKARFLLIIVIIVIIGIYLGIKAYQWFSVPSDVRQAAQNYFEYRVNGETEKALKNVYFKEENKEHYYLVLQTDEEMENYSINAIKKINDNLYEVNTTIVTTYFPELDVINYVMCKDGRWYFVINERDIDL